MTKVSGVLTHMCANGVPIEGDPCPKCEKWAAKQVEEALEEALEEDDPLAAHYLATATGADLDRIASNIGIMRKAAGQAGSWKR